MQWYHIFMKPAPTNVTESCIEYGGDLLLTPCKRELPYYPSLIAAEFKQNVIVATGPNQNIRCLCDPRYIDYMNCYIRVKPNSVAASVVEKRLNRIYPEHSHTLRPFFISPFNFRGDVDFAPILFSRPGCATQVFSGIHISTDENAKITRTLSSPPNLGRLIKTIPLHVCTDGSADIVCPVLRTEFQDRDAVFLLKRDAAKAEKGNVLVPCISAKGLRSMASVRADGKFLDPWKREGDHLLTIEQDYDAYILVANSEPCERPGLSESGDSMQFEREDMPDWYSARESLSDEDTPVRTTFPFKPTSHILVLLLATFMLCIVIALTLYEEHCIHKPTCTANYEFVIDCI